MPPYSHEHGGAVCNVAIARYATATVATGTVAGVSSPSARAPARPGDDTLVRAALRRAHRPATTATLASDFPIGAGLGGSSAAGVALAGALTTLAGRPCDRAAIAELSRRTEVEELGIAGGFQDHYAAAFGGALLLTFDQCVGVEQLILSPATVEAISRRVLLFYTGESRISAQMITSVVDACGRGEPRVHTALAEMKQLARAMAAALRVGDVNLLGALVGEHWRHQRALHPSITTERIDAIDAAATRNGALGMKALGASGGGCVLVVAREGREEELANALAPLAERIEYTVDESGFDVIAVLEERHGEGVEGGDPGA